MLKTIWKSLIPGVVAACAIAAAKPPTAAAAETLRIYVDADFRNASAVGDAVALGLETAIAQAGGNVAGHPLDVVRVDHRGTAKRSHHNMIKFLDDQSALAVFGGQQSPPYLTYGDFINSSGIPLLLPWSAAGPVTRMGGTENNYIFRLSVDDTKAGRFLIDTALESGCKRIALLLVDTGWGRANLATMTEAADAAGIDPVLTVMVNVETGPAAARSIARQVAKARSDCAIGVLTSSAGVPVIRGLHEIHPQIRFISHWGILTETTASDIPHYMRDQLRLRVLQTCGLQVANERKIQLDGALAIARALGANVQALADFDAPAAFAHGYDLGGILIAAVRQAAAGSEWNDGIRMRRRALKDALESLNEPVVGILRTYDRPYARVTPDAIDAHEALGGDDLCLAAFTEEGRLTSVDRGS